MTGRREVTGREVAALVVVAALVSVVMNWPMVLHVSGLPKLSKGGYYALYLTKRGRPLVSCGTINVSGATSVRLSAAYVLEAFDKDGWVIVRQTPANNFRPNQIVLRAI